MDLKKIVDEIEVKVRRSRKPILCNVSNRHLHLTDKVLKQLFGSSYFLRKLKDLVQPGEFASKETVEIVGPKGRIKNVRVLGPVRKFTQVEIARSDCFRLGVNAPVRDSGDIKGSAPIKIIGPQGEVDLKEGCIVARRHIHMTPRDAEELEVENGQIVRIEFQGSRGGILDGVVIRVSPKYALECHIDIDEANAFDFKSGGNVYIV